MTVMVGYLMFKARKLYTWIRWAHFSGPSADLRQTNLTNLF